MTSFTTTIANLPLAPLLSGAEFIPIDFPNGDGTFTSKKTSVGAIGTFPQTQAPFVTIGSTGGLSGGRQLLGTAGDIVLTDNGAGSTAVLSLATAGAAGAYGSASQTLALTVDTKGRVTAVTANALSVGNVSGAAPLASPNFTGAPTAPTATASDNSAALATTAFVKVQGYLTSTSAASTYLAKSNNLSDVASPSFARGNLGAAASGSNSDITSLSGLTTALSILQGGTGATNASNALNNLGAAAKGANSDITSLSGLTTALSAAQGGTGDTGGAWTTGSTTATSQAGTLGTNTVSYRYKKIGRIVTLQSSISISGAGTSPSGSINFTLPVAPYSGATYVGSGRENASTGKMLQCYVQGTSTISIINYDNTFAGGNGYALFATIVYESAS